MNNSVIAAILNLIGVSRDDIYLLGEVDLMGPTGDKFGTVKLADGQLVVKCWAPEK